MARTLIIVALFLFTSTVFSQKFLGQKNDIFACISDVSDIKTEIQTFLAGNVTLESLIDEIGTLTPLIQNALSDCGINITLPSLLSNTTEQVQVSFDFLTCLSDLNTLSTLAGDLISDASSGNIVNVVEDLVNIKTSVAALTSDCKVGSSVVSKGRVLQSVSENQGLSSIFDCVDDVETEVANINALIAAIKAGNFSDVLPLGQAVVDGINSIVADCGLSSSVEALGINQLHLDPVQCISDVSDVVQVVSDISSDLSEQNWSQLLQDLQTAVGTFEQLSSDCFSASLALNGECLDDVIAVANDVSDVIGKLSNLTDFSLEEILEIVNQLSSIINEVQTLEADCGFNLSLFTNERTVASFLALGQTQDNACFASISQIVTAVMGIANGNDSVEKITQILKIKSLIDDAKNVCFGSSSQIKTLDTIVPYVQAKGLRL